MGLRYLTLPHSQASPFSFVVVVLQSVISIYNTEKPRPSCIIDLPNAKLKNWNEPRFNVCSLSPEVLRGVPPQLAWERLVCSQFLDQIR